MVVIVLVVVAVAVHHVMPMILTSAPSHIFAGTADRLDLLSTLARLRQGALLHPLPLTFQQTSPLLSSLFVK